MGKLLSNVLHYHVLTRKDYQRNYFQINLPPDTLRIVGIEASFRIAFFCRPLLAYRRPYVAGLLRLRAEGTTNLFYNQYVYMEQTMIGPVDLGFTKYMAGFPASGDSLSQNVIVQGRSWEPEPINVPACRMIQGEFADIISGEQRHIVYRVSINLWVTTSDNYKTAGTCTQPS